MLLLLHCPFAPEADCLVQLVVCVVLQAASAMPGGRWAAAAHADVPASSAAGSSAGLAAIIVAQ